MKTNKIIGLFALFAISLSSCSDHVGGEDVNLKKVNFVSGVSQYETRISQAGDSWTASDAIGVFMTENNSSVVVNGARNISYTANNSAKSTAFTVVNGAEAISYPDGSDAVDFVAYYPYNTTAESFIYPISITNQSAGFTSSDLLYATSRNNTSSNVENVSLNFKHQLAKLKLNVVLEDSTAQISSATIYGINTASFNLKTGEIEEKGDISEIIPYNTSTKVYEAILVPADLTAANKVVFSVNGSSYQWVMAQNDANVIALNANTSYTFTINIKKNDVDAKLVSIEDGSIAPWDDESGSGSADKVPVTPLPEARYINTFDSVDGTTIIGSGSFFVDSDSRFGNVFQNVGGSIRTNYLLMPQDILSYSSTSQEMTIGVWVNAKNAGGSDQYAWSPLFTAYGAAPINGENTFPMFALQSRGVLQVNNAGYCDFTDDQNVKGINAVYNLDNDWLADGQWHYYTVTMTPTTVCIYFDGILKNKWVIDGTSDAQVLKGLFTSGSDLEYIALGGNQAWNWTDQDPGFMFDDFVVYDKALDETQINTIITKK